MKFSKSHPLSTNVNTDKESTTKVPIVKAVFDWVSSLFVKGAPSSTDNAIVRFDGITGKLIQNSSVTITDAGNVGIGTESPEVKLHINNGSLKVDAIIGAADVNVVSIGSNAGLLKINATGGTSGARFQVAEAQTGHWYRWLKNDGEALMSINNSGNVGIGTTSPTAKCDINSDTLRLRTAKTPASSSAAGNQGDICWDANYVYVCIATNTWKRSALATW